MKAEIRLDGFEQPFIPALLDVWFFEFLCILFIANMLGYLYEYTTT